MAIIAYIGVPGSGKSHESVKSVIIPNILQGRRIVTNVSGIEPQAILDYCVKHKKANIHDLGSVTVVNDSDVTKPDFLPYKKSKDDDYSGNDSFCKAGDLIVLDEVWRFWGSDKDLSNEHKSFVAEHRHFVDPETKQSCDLVLLNQALDTIPRFIKSRIETTFRMTKLTMIGAKSRYRVDVFNGVKLFKSSKTTSYQNKYDKEIFNLYHSYNGGKGNESTVDNRQNIFKQTKLWFLIIFFFIVLIFAITRIYSFFNQGNDSHSSSSEPVQLHNNVGASNTQNNIPDRKPEVATSKDWRITGTLVQSGSVYVVISDSSDNIRLINRSVFHGRGLLMVGTVDGQRVSYYSGKSK